MVGKILLITIELTVLGDALNGEPPRIVYYLITKAKGQGAENFVKRYLSKVLESKSSVDHELARKGVLDMIEKWPKLSCEQMTVKIEV